jgi:hypothetical protein
MHFDWQNILYGVTLMGIVAHAVNTFPTPGNVYGQWVLGIIKFAVGQRLSAMNAIRGNDTAPIAVPRGTGSSVQQAQLKTSNMQVTDEAITIKEKRETVIPLSGTGTGTGE